MKNYQALCAIQIYNKQICNVFNSSLALSVLHESHAWILHLEV